MLEGSSPATPGPGRASPLPCLTPVRLLGWQEAGPAGNKCVIRMRAGIMSHRRPPPASLVLAQGCRAGAESRDAPAHTAALLPCLCAGAIRQGLSCL